jgi:hypothetical protein
MDTPKETPLYRALADVNSMGTTPAMRLPSADTVAVVVSPESQTKVIVWPLRFQLPVTVAVESGPAPRVLAGTSRSALMIAALPVEMKRPSAVYSVE